MGATSLLKVTGLSLALTSSAGRDGKGVRKMPEIANAKAGATRLLNPVMTDLL
jgi:hypothetical protein